MSEMSDWNQDAVRVSGGISVSKNDKREWHTTTLPNGLVVVCISDVETEMAGAALAVSVGSFSDPPTLPGLAHFLEHMLFLGTEKYPDENSYSAFLSEHGGASNAYTAAEQTNYHFEVAPDALRETLDRFAAFFVCPLFTPSATARELQAVDAEHAKNVNSDMWRAYQLDKSTSAPEHPYSLFGTGDSRTLRDVPAAAGVDVRAALLALHATHYIAPRMRLVVYGREDTATLAAWAAECFSPVAASRAGALPSPPSWQGHPYAGRTGLRFVTVPVKDARTLLLSWAMPPLRDAAAVAGKPDRYLSHLLGHEGPGSLLSHLKARNWASELSAGTFDSESGFSTFSVSVTLTAEGLDAADAVVAAAYAYVGLLASTPPQRWVHDEVAAQAAASFRFASAQRPLSTVTHVAGELLEHAPAAVATGGALFTAWDPDAVSGLLARMTPANSRVRVSARALADACPLAEPWYGTPYGVAPFTDAQAAAWAAAASTWPDGAAVRAAMSPPLALPAPNDFIATDFNLYVAGDAAAGAAPDAADAGAAPSAAAAAVGGGALREPVPELLRADGRSEVWWAGDRHWAVPKLYVHAELSLPAAYTSPRAAVLTDLAARLLKEALAEIAYAAEVAELSWSVQPTVPGLALSFGGFSHKAAVLVRRVAERLAALTFTDAQFAVQLDRLERELANFDLSQPYSVAAYSASIATTTPRWHHDEKLAAVRAPGAVTPAALRAFLADGAGGLLSAVHVRVLVAGNADAPRALAAADALVGPLAAASAPALPSQLAALSQRCVALPPPTRVRGGGLLAWRVALDAPARNPADPNAAMDMLLQVGPQAAAAAPGGGASPASAAALARNALVDLTAHILAEPYFDALRTRQALGYVVMAGQKSEAGVDSLRLLAQSNKVPAAELLRRTEAFLADFRGAVAAMGGGDDAGGGRFAAHVAAVVAKKREGDRSLRDEAARLWGEVRAGTLDWARASREIGALRALTHGDLLAFYDDVVAPGGGARRAFVSLVAAGTAAGGGGATAGATEAGDGEEEGEEEEEEVATAAAGLPAGAREDHLAPAPPAAASPPPPQDAVVPELHPVVALPLAAAAALQHELALLPHAPPAWEAVAAAFARAGARGFPPAPVPCVTVQVAVAAPQDLRPLLPLHPDVGALRRAAVLGGLAAGRA